MALPSATVFACGGSIPVLDGRTTSNNSRAPSTSPPPAPVPANTVDSKAVDSKASPRPRSSAYGLPPVAKAFATPVVLRWDSSDPNALASATRVSFPLRSNQDGANFDNLLRDSERATFGLKDQNVLDETYRKARKLEAPQFATSFCPYALGIVDTVVQALLPDVKTLDFERTIRAELYSLNV